MAVTPDPRRLFTDRHAAYARFIRAVRYAPGLRAFFQASPLLRADLRILDAGCGTGALTLAVREAMMRRHLDARAVHAFDLTPAMPDRLRHAMERRGIDDVTLAEADVLRLETLPATWRDYDLIVSASMLEYVPRDRFVEALRGLRSRLRDGGTFVLFMTRRNALTRLLIGRWWQSNLYRAAELAEAFRAAGFTNIAHQPFPLAAAHLTLSGHVTTGDSPTSEAFSSLRG